MPFLGGLDLATKKDYSALTFLLQSDQNGQNRYDIHWIERLPHGISYPQQVKIVKERVGHASLQGSALAVDETGVGEAVVDMLRQVGLPVSIWPILITGGTAVSYDETRCAYRVPKRMLVSTLSVLLENDRLRMRAGLQFEDVLKTELRKFSSKITASGNEVFEAWRDSDHDDLILAVAMACWLGENTAVGWDGAPKLGPKGPMGDAPEGVFLGPDEPPNDPRFFGGRAAQGGVTWPSTW